MPEKWDKPIREQMFDSVISRHPALYQSMRHVGVNHLTFEGGWGILKKISCKHTCAKKFLHTTTAENKFTQRSVSRTKECFMENNTSRIYTSREKNFPAHERIKKMFVLVSNHPTPPPLPPLSPKVKCSTPCQTAIVSSLNINLC